MKKEAFALQAVTRCGHRERLRQRFRKLGCDGFSDSEKLEFLLMYSIQRKDTKVIAKNLLLRFGSISRIMTASSEELLQMRGIGPKTFRLLELIRLLNDDYLDQWAPEKEKINSAEKLLSFGLNYCEKTPPAPGTMLVIFMGTQCTLCGTMAILPDMPESGIYRKIASCGIERKASLMAIMVFDPPADITLEPYKKMLIRLMRNGVTLRLQLIDFQIIRNRHPFYICPKDELERLAGIEPDK